MEANADGAFQDETTCTPGADGFVLAAWTIDGSVNTDQGILIADAFCEYELPPGEPCTIGVSGHLLDRTSTGQVILSIAPCAGNGYVLKTTVVPPPSLRKLAKTLKNFISSLPPDVWWHPAQQHVLLQKARKVTCLVVRNDPCDLFMAMEHLVHDLLPRSDGQQTPHDCVTEPVSKKTLHEQMANFVERLDYERQVRPTYVQ